jgi:hypothetical protein
MSPKVVTYVLDDSTKVRFEIDPPAGFQDAGTDKVIGTVQEALAPAIETAKLVLDKLKEVKPGEVTVTFGLKVSGKLDWFIARAGTEGNFQVSLTWQPGDGKDRDTDANPKRV